MDKNSKINGFNINLALVDSLPVFLFLIMSIIISIRFPNPLFIVGSVLTFLAGLGKVLWKIIIALKKKDIKFLASQFRYTMTIGFILIIMSLFLLEPSVDFAILGKGLISLPSVIFFALGLIGMTIMLVLAFKLNKYDVKGNWIEQIINLLSQLCFLIGVILF